MLLRTLMLSKLHSLADITKLRLSSGSFNAYKLFFQNVLRPALPFSDYFRKNNKLNWFSCTSKTLDVFKFLVSILEHPSDLVLSQPVRPYTIGANAQENAKGNLLHYQHRYRTLKG